MHNKAVNLYTIDLYPLNQHAFLREWNCFKNVLLCGTLNLIGRSVWYATTTRLLTSDVKQPHYQVDLQWYQESNPQRGCGTPVVRVSDHGRHARSSSPVPQKTRRVGARCTLNLSRAQTSSHCCGVVVKREWCQHRCRP
ncbi:uncharacterized protein TNCV_2338911 [Trichonephila clavipes]|nr:uncharacterized protein TNCV_2338911 [Trichonephila clavipes]